MKSIGCHFNGDSTGISHKFPLILRQILTEWVVDRGTDWWGLTLCRCKTRGVLSCQMLGKFWVDFHREQYLFGKIQTGPVTPVTFRRSLIIAARLSFTFSHIQVRYSERLPLLFVFWAFGCDVRLCWLFLRIVVVPWDRPPPKDLPPGGSNCALASKRVHYTRPEKDTL